MTIREIFPNPLVKSAYFWLEFPNKHAKEEWQYNKLHKELCKNLQYDWNAYTYRSKSHTNFSLRPSDEGLSALSSPHKTYNLGKVGRFRDNIEMVVECFLKTAAIQIFPKVHLGYANVCPLPSTDNSTVAEYCNSAFLTHATARFNTKDLDAMSFEATVSRGYFFLTYREALQRFNNGKDCRLFLDLEGHAENVAVKECLRITDELHDMISGEFQKTIKQPIYDYMRMSKNAC